MGHPPYGAALTRDAVGGVEVKPARSLKEQVTMVGLPQGRERKEVMASETG